MKTTQTMVFTSLAIIASAACGGPDAMEAPGTVEQAAASTDYPGPCQNERVAPGTPAFLSADSNTRPSDSRIITLSEAGRFRLGISCVYSDTSIVRLGDNRTVFQHHCNKHGFGWYDAVNLAVGSYRVVAQALSFSIEDNKLVAGHETVDVYGYTGNGRAFQPVNCLPPGAPPAPPPPAGPSCGDRTCNGSENCATCSADCGECPSSPPFNCKGPTLVLPANTPICAEDTRKACLIQQSDGNLVVYDEAGRARWASNTVGSAGAYSVFQADGNLVVYRADGQPIWASNSSTGDPERVNYLCTQGDGNVVVYKWPRPVWATNTSH